jgi:uncharacterized membrane protein
MVEIIPNWHPVFVHFTIGLLVVSALFHVVAILNTKSTRNYIFENVANWNLWLGALAAVITVGTGWVAYNTVDHDTPSHIAMSNHRNWAMATSAVFIVLAYWSYSRARKAISLSWVLVMPIVLAALMLGITGYKGGELVYRFGLGVMTLPDTSPHHHVDADHDQDADQEYVGESEQQKSREASPEIGEHPHDHDHDHDHDHPHENDQEHTSDQSTDLVSPK